MGTGLLQGPFPTHTCFPSQKAPPWCGQSRASEGHQEQRSGPQPHLGSGAPGSYMEKIHKDVTSQTCPLASRQDNFTNGLALSAGEFLVYRTPSCFYEAAAPAAYRPLQGEGRTRTGRQASFY